MSRTFPHSSLRLTRLLAVAIVILFTTIAPGLASGVAAAGAAENGTISGAVFDANGAPVADAVVRLTGPQVVGGREAQTGANGSYKFDYLIPGEYSVRVEKNGIGSASRTAVVELGKDTQVDVVLGLTVSEQLTVTAAIPLVDTRSTEVSFNFSAEAINALPLERSYRGLFQLLPGVGDNRSVVGPVAGGGRQDNSYLVDGANITNPGFGYLSTEVNELDIAEVNLKRAGISAEFGRTGGSVTNVISRSGTNQLSVLARFDWLPQAFVAAYHLPDSLTAAGVKPGTFRDPILTTETAPAIGVGGPLKANRVFFYGSARASRQKTLIARQREAGHRDRHLGQPALDSATLQRRTISSTRGFAQRRQSRRVLPSVASATLVAAVLSRAVSRW
jgi:hypothetical protein